MGDDDIRAYAEKLEATKPLVEPVARRAVESLNLPVGSGGLDAGCGVGLQTVLLARAVRAEGFVTGVDMVSEFLRRAREHARSARCEKRVTFAESDIRHLPFADDSFDWAWSSDCIGYAPAIDPVAGLGELARVVRPGGTVAIAAWSSEHLFPGYPLLEAALAATTSGLAPFTRKSEPSLHFVRALGWFGALGMVDARAQTFAGTVHAPLEPATRAALIALIGMRRPGVTDELAPEDAELYRSLCNPASRHCIIDRPDYVAYYTYTLFAGTVA